MQLSLGGIERGPEAGQTTAEAYRLEMLVGLFVATYSGPASVFDTAEESMRTDLAERIRRGEISDIEGQNIARTLGFEED